MKVKSKIVARYGDKGRLKAVATVCLDGKFLVTGMRVADCQKGLSVFMPSREICAGEYRDKHLGFRRSVGGHQEAHQRQSAPLV